MTGKYLPAFSAKDAIASALQCGGMARLRQQLAGLYNRRHVFLFQSARNALYTLLRALGPTGAAVLPAYNCIAVPEAVQWAGWRPVFADIAAGDINMTCECLPETPPEDTRALIVTHQFGLPPPLDPILEWSRQRSLFVVEDAAPALGARYHGRMAGSFGDATIISFHLTKVINAGRGGALLMNDDEVAKKVALLQDRRFGLAGSAADCVKSLAWWGATRPVCYQAVRKARSLLHTDPLYEVVAPNDTPPGEVLRPCSGFVARLADRQLRCLSANVAARQERARVYQEELVGLDGIELPRVAEGVDPSWIQFPIFVQRKEACYHYLLQRGVDLNWTFRYSCGVSYRVQHAPNSERAARMILGLPTYPGLPLGEATRICGLMRDFARG